MLQQMGNTVTKMWKLAEHMEKKSCELKRYKLY